ncbi:hypothetical protein ACFOJ6_13335 [Gordonia humi]
MQTRRPTFGSPVCPVDAVLLLVGAIAAVGSYVLPWYVDVDRPTLSVTGLGQVSDPGHAVHSGRLNWMIAAAAIGGLVLGAYRLSGRIRPACRRPATVIAAVAAGGVVFDVLAAPDGMRPTHGLAFAASGAAATAVGALVCRRRAVTAARASELVTNPTRMSRRRGTMESCSTS